MVAEGSSRRQLPALLILLGCLCIPVFILLRIPGPVFFSGDAGLKLLLVQQLSGPDRNQLPYLHHPLLDDPERAWLAELWQDPGIYPYQPPFVYRVPALDDRASDGDAATTTHRAPMRHLVVFPLFFPLLSVPGYELFGVPGLRLVPLLSVVFFALLFHRCVRRWRQQSKLDDEASTLTLALVLLASPIPLYGALVWEHALALVLSFLALEAVLNGPPRGFAGRLLLGVVTGLAVWLRPEAALFLALLALLWWPPRDELRRWLPVGLAGGLTVAGFLAFNQGVYGHPLGAHSFQLLATDENPLPETAKILPPWQVFTEHLEALGFTFPAAIACLLVLAWSWRYRGSKGQGAWSQQWRLALLVALFVGLISFLVPNAGGKQWGPRYLLPILPALGLLAGLQWQGARAALAVTPSATWPRRGLHGLVLVLFAGALVLGLMRNAVGGSLTLVNDFRHRIYPGLSYLQQSTDEVVVFGNEWVPQEMAVEFRDRNFLRFENGASLHKLARALVDHGHRSVLYLTDIGAARPPQRLELSYEDGMTVEMRLEVLDQFGYTAALRLHLRPVPNQPAALAEPAPTPAETSVPPLLAAPTTSPGRG